MKTAVAAYQTRTDALQKAPAYYVRAYVLTGGIPSGTERAFSRDFATAPLQAQTGTKLICLDAPQGNVQTVFPEQGQSSIGSFTFPLYDRDGEITRQIGNPKKGLLAAITATVPATGGNLDANGPVDGYPAKGVGKIDDEIFLYTSLDTVNNRFVNITRAAHGTTAAAHAINATIHNFERLRLGSRLQLFAGYTDLNEADFMSFAKMEVVDIRLRQDLSTYEIVCADVQRFTRARIFTGATADATVTKTGNPVTLALQVLLTSTTAGKNHVTYDLGDGNGLDLHPALVDIAGLESLRDTEFAGNTYSFTIREPQDAKAWLEREIWQTLNCVVFITQDGKYSAKRLKNAGATVGSITKDHVVRVVGWREATDRVINVLDFRYDFDLDGNPNAFGKRRIYLMDNSIADFGRRPALVIESRGIKSANGGDTIADNRALRISDRWASPPPALVLDLFYEKHLFDIGDQVSVTLPEVPDLKGVRSLTSEVFEVLDIRPLFDPTGQAGMQVTLLWLGSVILPPAPTSTTATPGTLERDRTAPAVPTGLALTTGSDVLVDGTFEALISATWTGNTESDLEGYRLRIKKTSDGASAWSTFTMGKAVAGIIVRGLQPNTAYEAQVSAFDFWGNESAFSASVTTTTPGSPGAPAIPTGLAATARTLSILLTWNANPELDIANYEVQRADDTGFLTNAILRRIDALFFVETPGDTTTRHYRIRATRRSGAQSAFTTHVSVGALAVSAADLEAAAPATPTGLTLTTGTQLDPGDGTVKPFLNLAWNANAESDLAYYQVDYRRQGDTPFSSQLVRKEILSARYYGVVGNVVYEARIAAIDRLGNASAFTVLSTITTAKDTSAPAAPTAVTVTPGFQLNLVRWTPPTDVDFDVVEVWRSTTNDSAIATKIGESKGISFVDDKLANRTQYFYWLKSRDTSLNVSGFHATQFAGVAGTTLDIQAADVIQTGALITLAAQIANAIINSAHITDLSADKITAGLIDVLVRLGVNNIELDGVNSVITIKDTQGVPVTRVQIGKLGAGAGDWGIKIFNASGVLMWDFSSGVQTAGVGDFTITPIKIQTVIGHGQCRLTMPDTGTIKLSPFNGNKLMVKVGANWQIYAIPAAGITLAVTGLIAGTTYFIYAFDSSGTLALEASTTGHVTDSDTMVEVKNADATRTLVGMVSVVTGPAFADSLARRFVLSYFNRHPRALHNQFTANRTTTSTSFVEINTEIRCQFLIWANDTLEAHISGACSRSATGGTVDTLFFVNGAASGAAFSRHSAPSTGMQPLALSLSLEGLNEAVVNYVSLAGNVSAETGTWLGGLGTVVATHINGFVLG